MNDFLEREKEDDPAELIRNSNALMKQYMAAQKKEQERDEARIAREEASRKQFEAAIPPQLCQVTSPPVLSRQEILKKAARAWAEVKQTLPDAPPDVQLDIFRGIFDAPDAQ